MMEMTKAAQAQFRGGETDVALYVTCRLRFVCYQQLACCT
jgi:hypothetical protein